MQETINEDPVIFAIEYNRQEKNIYLNRTRDVVLLNLLFLLYVYLNIFVWYLLGRY